MLELVIVLLLKVNKSIKSLLNVLLKKTEAQAKQESDVTIDKSLQTAS